MQIFEKSTKSRYLALGPWGAPYMLGMGKSSQAVTLEPGNWRTMDFYEAISGLWDAWLVLLGWIPFWDPWGAITAAFFLLYFLGRLSRRSDPL